MIGSKAVDVETKIVSDSKAAGEGPTCDCICDSFFQFVLGIRIKTVADSQLVNMTTLLNYLPQIDENNASMLGPITVCDHGYGKKSLISLLGERNYKVLTIASSIGSEHPIVGSTIVESYVDKINSTVTSTTDLVGNYGVLQSNTNEFKDSIKDFTISDDPSQLLGPQVLVVQHRNQSTLFAYAYLDIHDKKSGTKTTSFFCLRYAQCGIPF
jgi:hypothetical protein